MAGAAGGALLQPPNSSSALTFGVVPAWANPLPPGTILWLASGGPEPHPKSLAGAGAAAGLAELQASFVPMASKLLHPLEAAVVAAGAGWAFGAGWEAVRLKTEAWEAAGEVTGLGGDVAAGAAGVEKSKRSFMPELCTAGDVGRAGAELNASKPPEELVVRELVYDVGFAAGFASKKLPLLTVNGGEDTGGDRWD